MISRAPNRLFLRGRLKPSQSLQRQRRAKIIVSSVALSLFISLILTALARPRYPARIVIDTGYPGCEHGMIHQQCGGCDDCVPLSTKFTERLKNLASNLKRALE